MPQYHPPQSGSSDNPVANAINGFESRSTSGIGFVNGTRTFTIQPTSGSFDFWNAGEKYSSSGDSIVIADIEGVHLIYYDKDVLKEIVNPAYMQMNYVIRYFAIVSIIYWDATNKIGIYVGEERHGTIMSPATHANMHFTRGLQWVSGCALANFSTDDIVVNTSSAQFSIDSGIVEDEDIVIATDGALAVDGAPIYHRIGASSWRRDINPGFCARTYDNTSGTRLAYNKQSGGVWSLAQATHGDFVLYHIFETTEKDSPEIALMGQNLYTTRSLARDGAETEINNLLLNNTLTPEITPIATVIYQTKLSYANNINARIRSTNDGGDYIDWRKSNSSRTVSIVKDVSEFDAVIATDAEFDAASQSINDEGKKYLVKARSYTLSAKPIQRTGQSWMFEEKNGGVVIDKTFKTLSDKNDSWANCSLAGSVCTLTGGGAVDLSDVAANPSTYKLFHYGTTYQVSSADNIAKTITVSTPFRRILAPAMCCWANNSISGIVMQGVLKTSGVEQFYGIYDSCYRNLKLSADSSHDSKSCSNVVLPRIYGDANNFSASWDNVCHPGPLSCCTLPMVDVLPAKFNDANTYNGLHTGGSGAKTFLDMCIITTNIRGMRNSGSGNCYGILNSTIAAINRTIINGISFDNDVNKQNLGNANTSMLIS